jgi:hypothetical protein
MGQNTRRHFPLCLTHSSVLAVAGIGPESHRIDLDPSINLMSILAAARSILSGKESPEHGEA